MTIKEELEELFANNGTDFEISKAFKTAIKEYKSNLDETFSKNQGKDFLVKHTATIDLFVSLIYKTVLRKFFGNYLPMSNSIPIAIVALGSYGREQLALYSDIDLMIVYEDIPGYNVKELIESFLHIAWDAKLDLGHRVHTVGDLLGVSKEDITIKTALLESRFITGSTFTWNGTQNAINLIRKNDQQTFIFAKIDESRVRRKKYPRSMQPNLKEGIGGLRDANLMFWIAFVKYGVTSLRDLSGTLFSEEAYKEYRQALEFLFRTRSALHLIAGKKQDTLVLERIPDVTQKLGISDDKTLVSKLLQSMHTINSFSKITVNKLVRPHYHYSCDAPLRSTRITKDFFYINQRLYTRQDDRIHKIGFLLNVVHKLPDEKIHFNSSVLNAFVHAKIPQVISHQLFQQIYKLFERKHLYPILELLYDAKLLGRVIPPLEKVNFLAQFDGYHKYPVTIHSMKCIQSLENITNPFIADLYEELPLVEKAFLKLVVLVHDSGKGRTQDHHEVGAKLFHAYAKQLGLNENSIAMGMKLIKYHTFMSAIAFKEDIYHEDVLFKFMSVLGNQKMLNFLYIMTYADINGVGPDTFTSFNERLLHELYINALNVVNQSSQLDEAGKRLKKEQSLQKNAIFLAMPKIRQKDILAIASNLFFIKNSTAEILHLANRALDIEDYRYYISNDKHLRIEIYRKIPLNIGYLLAKLSFLSIVTMDIFKLYNNLKYFRIDFNEHLNNDELNFVQSIIEDAFDMNKKVKLANISINTNDIQIDCEHSKTYASMKLVAPNQKGLLAFIMTHMDQLGINIATAKIHTIKNRAQDSFLIEKTDNLCQNSDKIISMLTQRN